MYSLLKAVERINHRFLYITLIHNNVVTRSIRKAMSVVEAALGYALFANKYEVGGYIVTHDGMGNESVRCI